jgi:hypothetical protein
MLYFVDSNGENQIFWNDNSILADELLACFPDCKGLVVIDNESRKAIRASDGEFKLSEGRKYVVPVPRSTNFTKEKKKKSALVSYFFPISFFFLFDFQLYRPYQHRALLFRSLS